MERRLKRRSLVAAFASLPFAERALADDWPAKPVRIVCPFTPGGSQDNIARRISAKLGEQLGQSFVIDNRSGAGGSIAADNVAKSPPDGYSVLLGNIGSHALVPHIYAKPPYDPLKDFETAAWIGTQPNLLVCHPSFPHDTMPKLIAAAKAEPGKYSYGNSGISTSPALTMELLKQRTGIDVVSISYRGASASSADVVAGHIPMCIANVDSLSAQVKAGKLKAIASTGAGRTPAVPEAPTLVEAGLPDLVVTSWSLWAVPTGTPVAIRDKLRAATDRALKDTDVIESMRLGGFEPGSMSIVEADAFIRSEHKRWGEVIRAAGIKLQ
jgi:tripartite-type tricarboxylate transporter receptor subunit TctC